MDKTLKKLKTANVSSEKYSGPLPFVNNRMDGYFVENGGYYGLVTYSGKYGGLSDAYQRGAEYRERYGYLWNKHSRVPVWTGGYERIVQTARAFGEGFFNWNYTDIVMMNVVSEQVDQGANSLTPQCVGRVRSEACNATVHDVGKVNPYYLQAAERLNNAYEGLNLTAMDIHNIQQLSSYEMNVRSWSPWLDVFTKEEWTGYEYTRSMYFYYCAGPGAGKSAVSEGSIFTNSTLELLKHGPGSDGIGSLYFTFTHDTDQTPILAALGLTWPNKEHPPWNGTFTFYDGYSASEIIPMGAHLVLERMKCRKSVLHDEGIYIRAVLNEAVKPLPDCQNGLGFPVVYMIMNIKLSDHDLKIL